MPPSQKLLLCGAYYEDSKETWFVNDNMVTLWCQKNKGGRQDIEASHQGYRVKKNNKGTGMLFFEASGS
jgi:hypothetical protein